MHPILVSKFAVFPLRWWIFFTFLLSLSVYTITFLLFTYRVSDKPCVDSGRDAAPRVFKRNNLFNECDRPSTRIRRSFLRAAVASILESRRRNGHRCRSCWWSRFSLLPASVQQQQRSFNFAVGFPDDYGGRYSVALAVVVVSP